MKRIRWNAKVNFSKFFHPPCYSIYFEEIVLQGKAILSILFLEYFHLPLYYLYFILQKSFEV
ncbi:MAG: hypothetical protein ACTSVU_08820, partial [Promethearchaeota archaeon]